ncbi:MAG TPA: M43 family zinc metalloprotease, partial [Flavisolibacter sp.]|nr:M43 family zinc metalloprotease [Flavisolibacter sp.]
NDQVGDTPAHDASNGGCPSSTLRSRCTGKPLEQWMNYMDYTDDACMYMFTAGQKTRMDAAIDASRAAYVRTTK